jgi:glucan phosphoethanolaminetransferase (alkaline phosphatase superfamily)
MPFGNISRGTKMKKKNILFIVIAVLLLLSVINFFTGTTITINGKQVTGMGNYIAAYLALFILAVALVILIPSVLILAVVLLIIFAAFVMLFFPLMPVASLLLPTIILAGIIYLIYRLVKKKK